MFGLRHPGLWRQHAVVLWLYGCCKVVMSGVDLAASATGRAAVSPLGAHIPVTSIVKPVDAAIREVALHCFGGGANAAARLVEEAAAFTASLFAAPGARAAPRIPAWFANGDDAGYTPSLLRTALKHYSAVIVDGESHGFAFEFQLRGHVLSQAELFCC